MNQGIAGAAKTGKGEEGPQPRGFAGGAALLTSGFYTPRLKMCERSFCGFKAPS